MEVTNTKTALARIDAVSERLCVTELYCQTRFGSLMFEYAGTLVSRWQPVQGSHVELYYHEEPNPDYLDILRNVVTGVNHEPNPDRSVQSGILRCNWDYPKQCQLFSDSGQSLIGYVEPCFISGYQRIRDFVSCQVRVGFEADVWGADEESITILTL